jgi:hypothetical protein
MARYRGGDGHYADVECAYAELKRYLVLNAALAVGSVPSHPPAPHAKVIASRAATGGTAMAFKVGDAVRLKSGGAQMIVSKLFISRRS